MRKEKNNSVMQIDTKDLYKTQLGVNPNFNYYFDKITSKFIKSKRCEIENPKKILFLRNDHIGDMVYSTQIFREVKKIFPNSEISVLASPSNRQIIEKNPYVNNILEIDLFWRRGLKGFLDYFKILKRIKKEKFDVGIDLRRSKLNIIFFLWIPRIKKRASIYNINGGKAFLTHPILYNKKENYIQEVVDLVNESLGINIKNFWPQIVNNKEDEKDVEKLREQNDLRKYVVFAPGATADSKRWPEEKFDKLIEEFHKKYPNYKIVLSGAESDKNLINRLCKKSKEYCVPLINFNLKKMALVFKNAGVVIANDGCATDISWVAGGKLISLVGPVDLDHFKPLKKSKIIHHKLDCYPCLWANPCKKPLGKWCMDLITVEEVMNAINEFMKERK
jgi:ADP-heptose:LPS heptosyltransferase